VSRHRPARGAGRGPVHGSVLVTIDLALRRRATAKGLSLRLRPSVVVGSSAVFGGVAVAVASAGGAGAVLGAALGAVLGGAAPLLGLLAWPDQRAKRLEVQVPALLEATARSLRGGRSLVRAFADAAAAAAEPLGTDARAVALRVDAGVPLREALRDAAQQVEVPAWRTALVALGVAQDAGGPQAMVLDSLAAAIRGRTTSERELRALTTPVRVSAGLLAVAPVAVFGAIAALDPATLRAATASSIGIGAAVVGLVLDALGFWWIRVLTRAR
jgi:tight adherence protein B